MARKVASGNKGEHGVSLPVSFSASTSCADVNIGDVAGREAHVYILPVLAGPPNRHLQKASHSPSFSPPFDAGSIRPPSPSFSLLGILLLDEMLVMPYRRTVQLPATLRKSVLVIGTSNISPPIELASVHGHGTPCGLSASKRVQATSPFLTKSFWHAKVST